MAEHGFYRSSGAAWQRALPCRELCRPDDGEVLRRGWDLLALDREGARRDGPGRPAVPGRCAAPRGVGRSRWRCVRQ